MKTRRWVLGAGLAAAGCTAVPTTEGPGPGQPSGPPQSQPPGGTPNTPPSAPGPATSETPARAGSALRAADILFNRAVEAAGGENVLSRARVLTWTGQASVYAGDKRIDLNVQTAVEPFTYALSDTWLRDQGRASLRTLEIDGNQGWLIRDGERTPMSDAALRHEKQQYATYGLMRLVSLRDAGAAFSLPPGAPANSRVLEVHHPNAQDSRLTFAADGRLVALENTVDAPDGGAPIPQRFEFSGRIKGRGVVWPRSLRLYQAGNLYFTLDLASFTPREVR
ncbi:MAG: hypothetical protein U1E87_05215 [Alphaproteobacteria bacterium]